MPGIIIGELRPDLPDELGAPRKTKVILGGCHDTACAFYAAKWFLQKQDDKSTAYLSSGTWSLPGLITEAPVINEAAFVHDLGNEGMVDGTNRLLKIITGMWLVDECRLEWASEGVTYSNEELARLLGSTKGVEPIIDVDSHVFVSPGTAKDKMTDRIKKFCSSHGLRHPMTHGEVIATVLSSIAAAYAKAVRHIERASGVKIERICVIGGGSRNEPLNRLTERATGLPLVLGPSEATALGNIIVQMQTTGEASRL
jgi:rhamnulokinase